MSTIIISAVIVRLILVKKISIFSYLLPFVQKETKPLTTAAKINEDVSEATKGLIKEIITSIPSDTALILINAIYFKGDWQEKFDKSKTKPMKFKVSPNKIVDYPEGMNLRKKLLYAKIKGKLQRDLGRLAKIIFLKFYFHTYSGKKGEDMEIVALNYTNTDFRMLFILPDKCVKNVNLADIDFETLNDKLRSIKLTLKLPKFKIEYENQQLENTFKALGVKEIFKDSANLEEITDAKVSVSKIIHKAVIEVQEEGAEAAAATAIVMESRSANRQQQKVIEFDRPFLFIIQDVNHRIPLFMGRIVDPRYFFHI